MSRLFRVLLIASLLVGLAPVLPVAAQPDLPPNCSLIPVPNSIEVYLICLPWPPTTPPQQFDLVVFAHGYVPPNETSMTKYIEQMWLSDGTFLPSLANSMGYAFASTSYTKNGLAVKEGLADTVRLIKTFKQQYPGVRLVYLIGASEGGLITTLAAEQQTPIDGGLALCGPIGSFRGQINYWGDFRVLFDYFYRQALPSSPVRIPPGVMVNWEHLYVPRIAGLIGNPDPNNQLTTLQLLNTSGAPIDEANPSTAIDTTVGILSYNVFATNEARDELGGQPFDNIDTKYEGSADDTALNGPRGVQRFAADPAALLEIGRYYETSGELKVPLVTMHTSGDPIVPYWHETRYYNEKILKHGESVPKYFPISIDRYGHCTFNTQEAQYAFAVLVGMVTAGQ
jgi:pimeloyl-ACP methyl ester carboxylesterase